MFNSCLGYHCVRAAITTYRNFKLSRSVRALACSRALPPPQQPLFLAPITASCIIQSVLTFLAVCFNCFVGVFIFKGMWILARRSLKVTVVPVTPFYPYILEEFDVDP